jgi:hypothetical protein
MSIKRVASPWRPVTSYEVVKMRHSAPGAFSRVFTLECGHTIARKGSQGTPARMRCMQCPQSKERP